MPREAFQTLTVQMYYILLVMYDECCGVDIMERVQKVSDGEITIGPGTLYTLLGKFEQAGLIKVTAIEGRKKSYILTSSGKQRLKEEYHHLKKLVEVGQHFLEDKHRKEGLHE